jgi:hypothetical protein
MPASGRGPLRIAIEDFIETFHFGDLVRGGVRTWIEEMELEAADTLLEVARGLEVEQYLPQYIRELGNIQGRPRQPIGIIPILLGIVGIIWGVLQGSTRPITSIVSYKVETLAKSFRLDPVSAIQALKRSPAFVDLAIADMTDQGLTQERIQALSYVLQPILPALELERLRRKGAISEDEYQNELGSQGYTPPRIEQVKALFEAIPNVSDLIRIAVREGFSDDVAQRFSYDEAYPATINPFLEAQGLSSEWGKRYWRSHWELPSLTQGFEMFQRLRPGRSGVTFTDDDLDLLMRTADIAPYFRPRLKEIAYSPLTRVDVRRMFGQGVLTEAQVYEAYRDLGYNQENAQHLTDFTVKFERQAERGLTREAVQAAYKRGLVGRDAAIASLSELGYPADIADFYLDIVDYDTAGSQTDEKLAAIRTQFLAGVLDDSTVNDKLGPLNLPSERVQGLLELWAVQKAARVSLPSRGELDDWYRRDLIEADLYRSYLKRDGYQDTEIDIYVRRIDQIVQDDAKIEAATALAEQARVRASGLASKFQVTSADLDVQIANERLKIANNKLALFGLEDLDEVTRLKTENLELSAEIKELQVDKTKLKLDLRRAQSQPALTATTPTTGA